MSGLESLHKFGLSLASVRTGNTTRESTTARIALYLALWVLLTYATYGNKLLIYLLVLDRVSQWVVGSNVTSRSDTLKVGERCLRTLGPNGTPMRIALLERGIHLHLLLSLFASSAVARAHTSSVVFLVLDWPAVRRLVDRVHLHLCGHSSFADINILLEQTHNLTSNVKTYLTEVASRCVQCFLTARPEP